MVKLTAQHQAALQNFITTNSDFTTFLAGNIFNYAFNSATVDTWGQFDDKGTLTVVLQRYDNFFVLYGSRGDCGAVTDIIRNYPAIESLAGRANVIEPYAQHFTVYASPKHYMHYVDKGINHKPKVAARLATVDNCAHIEQLLLAVEFGFSPGEIIERYKRTVAKSEARYYFVEQDGLAVACAATAAESATSAMIVSVCCRSEYRQNGYAQACMNALINQLNNEGKAIYLFCENPIAKAMYEKLGFVDIGVWAVLDLEKVSYER